MSQTSASEHSYAWHPDMHSLDDVSELSRCSTPILSPRLPPPPIPTTTQKKKKKKKKKRRKSPPLPCKCTQVTASAESSHIEYDGDNSDSESNLSTGRPQFNLGERVFDFKENKIGECIFLYNDDIEQRQHWVHNEFHYWVLYEDGRSGMRVPQTQLLHIKDDLSARDMEDRFRDTDTSVGD